MRTHKAIPALAAAFVFTLGAAFALAHNGIEHVMGTLSAKSDNSVTVETLKHTKLTVMLDKSTAYSFNDNAASLNDLKLGERVVVNVKDDANDKPHAVSIRWGAKSTAAHDHDEHTH